MRTRKKHLASKRLVKKMTEMKEVGMTYAVIGKEFNIPPSSVFYYIKNNHKGWTVPEFVTQLTEAHIGYIAGIIDGEGTINLYQKWKGEYTYPQVCIRIYNTDKRLIDYLLTLVPFYHSMERDREERRGKKRVHRLTLWGVPRQYFLLKTIYPHLIIKKENTKKCLQYLSSKLRDIEELGVEDVKTMEDTPDGA